MARSPIEMMIDKATGYVPGSPPKYPQVTLRCPKCKRTKEVRKDSTDLKNAAVVEIQCDKCDRGDGFPETFYYDADGRQLNPATGKPFRNVDSSRADDLKEKP